MRLKLFADNREFAASIKVAVARLHLPNGQALNNQVVAIDEEGFVMSYGPLEEEQAFTEWFKGDAFVR